MTSSQHINGLLEIRERIDEIDRGIVDLLADRMERSTEIGRLGAAAGLPIDTPLREHQVIDAATARGLTAGLDPRSVRLLYRLVIEQSRAAQSHAAERSGPAAATG